MKSIAILAAAILLIAEPKPADSWGQGDRDQILKMHNDYRKTTVKEKGACHMNVVEYDMAMEKDAEAYAKKCHYQHVMDKYGENFAFDTNKNPQTELVKSSVDAWYGEIKTYRYDQNACGDTASCHYTQMIAASLKKIGCYSHRCPNLVGGAPNAWFLVCYYTPKGNWKGEKSYPKNCKTPCLEGQTEEAGGLCSGEGEEEGAEKFECKDSTHYCRTWQQSGQCKLNPTYMKKKCPVSCQECIPEGGVPEIGCVDNDPRCPSWSQKGYCQKKADQMKQRCPKSCKHCS